MEKKEYRYYLKLSLQHHLCTIGITESSNGKQQRHYATHSEIAGWMGGNIKVLLGRQYEEYDSYVLELSFH
jgi:hypothetical protein